MTHECDFVLLIKSFGYRRITFHNILTFQSKTTFLVSDQLHFCETIYIKSYCNAIFFISQFLASYLFPQQSFYELISFPLSHLFMSIFILLRLCALQFSDNSEAIEKKKHRKTISKITILL